MKKFIVTGVVALALATSATTSVFASGTKPFGFTSNKDHLTDEQRTVVEQYRKDLDDLNSNYRQKFAESGIVMDELPIENHRSKTFFDAKKISELTEEQKSQLNDLKEEKEKIEKAYTEKALEAGIITQEQVDKIEEHGRETEKDRISRFRFSIGGSIMSVRPELTIEQKSIVEDYKSALSAISVKELDLYIEFGIISAEDAEALKERAESGNFNIRASKMVL